VQLRVLQGISRLRAEVAMMTAETLGGKPSTATPADRRLKRNRDVPPHPAPTGTPGGSSAPTGRPAPDPSSPHDQATKRPVDRARQVEHDKIAREVKP
jgi:hypothetical protein